MFKWVKKLFTQRVAPEELSKIRRKLFKGVVLMVDGKYSMYAGNGEIAREHQGQVQVTLLDAVLKDASHIKLLKPRKIPRAKMTKAVLLIRKRAGEDLNAQELSSPGGSSIIYRAYIESVGGHSPGTFVDRYAWETIWET